MANPKLELLKQIHKEEEALYAERNEKYGDSFSRTYQNRGSAAVLIRLEDKLSRVDYLLTHGLEGSDGESIIDTLKDLSNYANMAIMELMNSTTPATEATDGAGNQPEKKAKKKSKKKAKKEATEAPAESQAEAPKEEEGPLANLTRKQLAEVLKELGGQPPKKANREILMEQISQYPMPKVAVAITSLKSSAEETEENGEG